MFAIVVKTSTIRLVLLLAAARDHNLSSVDIRQAYLQSLLDPNVPLYMRLPPDVFPRRFQAPRCPLALERALVRPLIACVESVVTAITSRLVATLACLVDTLDRRANWVTTLSEPALTALVNALHRGYVGKRRA